MAEGKNPFGSWKRKKSAEAFVATTPKTVHLHALYYDRPYVQAFVNRKSKPRRIREFLTFIISENCVRLSEVRDKFRVHFPFEDFPSVWKEANVGADIPWRFHGEWVFDHSMFRYVRGAVSVPEGMRIADTLMHEHELVVKPGSDCSNCDDIKESKFRWVCDDCAKTLCHACVFEQIKHNKFAARAKENRLVIVPRATDPLEHIKIQLKLRETEVAELENEIQQHQRSASDRLRSPSQIAMLPELDDY